MSTDLVLRTAKAIYREDPAVRNHVDWGSLPDSEQARYRRMACAALAVGLAAPVERSELSPV